MNCIYCNKSLTILQQKRIVSSVKRERNKQGNHFCSYSCSSAYTIKYSAKQREENYDKNPVKCKNCEIRISYEKFIEKKTDKKNKNKLLETINFFCSKSCSAIYNNKGNNRHKKITRGINSIYDIRSNNILKELLKVYKLNKCSICGTNDISMDIHHINGRKVEDPHNHNNLTIVCPNCHRRIEQNVICTDKLIKLSDVLDDNWKNYLPEKYR